MLATLADQPFDRPGWVYEEKYDGIRLLAMRERGDVKLWSRNLIDNTARFAPIAEGVTRLPGGDLILDGEAVTFDEHDVSRFQLLHGRGSLAFAVFDCLMRDGVDLISRPLNERRHALEAIIPAQGGMLMRSRRLTGDGFSAYRHAQEHDWEGIIAKDESSPYQPGRRSRSWLKVKVRKEAEFVIGGFSAPKKSRQEFGALLVGLFDGPKLRYAGKVGTGFTAKTLAELGAKLRALATESSPFSDAPRMRDATWVSPQLVAQLAFHEWTGDGKLRHPAFLGLRTDKSPAEITWAIKET